MSAEVIGGTSEVSVIYDGPALTGRMEVKQLAPSLLAFSDLLHLAQRELNPQLPGIRIDLVATGTGSFEVVLDLSYLAEMANLLNSSGFQAAATFSELVAAVAGLLRLIKRIAGRPYERQPGLEEGETRIIFRDGTELRTRSDSLSLYESRRATTYAENFAQPLREDVHEVRVVRQGQTEVSVGPDDLPAIEQSARQPGDIQSHRTELAMEIVSPSFKRDNKWRLRDGGMTYWVSIEDEDFWQRIESSEERFGKGDRIRVVLVTNQWDDPDGSLRSEHIVERVVSHSPRRSRYVQQRFEVDSTNEEDQGSGISPEVEG